MIFKIHYFLKTKGPDRNIYVIVDHDYLWKYLIREKHWTQLSLDRTYPGLIGGVVGGVLDRRNVTWFFKGNYIIVRFPTTTLIKKINFVFCRKARKVWAYKGHTLVAGFPKVVNYPLYPRHPFTAVMKGDKMYLLRVNFVF